jgi:histidinol phosphatase-like enzyme (inositol monophosphatase family)
MSPALSADRLAELDGFLVELHRASAAAILPLFRAPHDLADKNEGGAFDPVTAADKGAEAAVRSLIAERYPEHGVIGEEYGEDRPGAELVWVIDPIDGTRAFVAGLPVWTTLIGLRVAGAPTLGSIGQPYVGELFIGSAAGSRLMSRGGARPLQAAPCGRLADAKIATTDEGMFDERQAQGWRKLRARSRLARFGCDAYAYAMVAMGHLDLVVESGLKPWDIEPLLPVLAGAGGVFSDWRGEALTGGQVAIAGDQRCLEEAVGLLAAYAE